jgi:hypothetical protein
MLAKVLGLIVIAATGANAASIPSAATGPGFEVQKDAVVAAPDRHKILLENPQVRVLAVRVPAMSKEPFHNHRWPAAMYVLTSASLKDAVEGIGASQDVPATAGEVIFFPPERNHSIENVGSNAFSAIRVEIKRLPHPVPEGPPSTPQSAAQFKNEFVQFQRMTVGKPAPQKTPSLLISQPSSDNAKAFWVSSGETLPDSVKLGDILVVWKFEP